MFTQSYGNVKFDVKNMKAKLPDGTILDSSILSDICLGYERMCTADYLLSCFNIKTITAAWDNADSVRNLMDDYGYTESEAIDEVLQEI